MADMTEIGGLWIGESDKGKYMSGRLKDDAMDTLNAADGAGRVFVFRNKEKTGKQPDYRLMFAPDDDARPAPKKRQPDEDDDLPPF